MNRALKIVLGLLAAVLALVVGLAVAVALLFDTEEFKPLLVQSVEKATGREFRLDGELGLGFFPCCSVRLGHAALGNPPGFAGEGFASVEKAELSIRIWPLLSQRRVEIGLVRLDGLDASLRVGKDGRANWDFEDAGKPSGQNGSADAAGSAGMDDFHISGLRIRNGRVSYVDEQAASSWLAEELDLETGALAPGEPFELRLSTRLADGAGSLAGQLALRASAVLDTDAPQLLLQRPALDFDFSGSAIPARSLKGEVGATEAGLAGGEAAALHFSGLEGTLRAQGLNSPAGDLSASFSAAEGSLGLDADGRLRLPALQAGLEIKGRDIPGGSLLAKASLKELSADLDAMTGTVGGFDMQLSGFDARLLLKGSGKLGEKGSDLGGSLELEPVSPRKLLAALGEEVPRTADPQALTRLAGTAGWKLGKDALDLSKLDFRLDDTRIAGSLGIRGFDKPLTRFDLQLDQLDADRYLEPDAPKATGSGKAQAAAGDDDIPVETLRALRLDGRLAIGRLQLAGTRLDELQATVRADGGRLRLDPLSARLYGGSYRGSIGIDASGPQARISLDQQLDALQVGAALADLYQTDKLSGALSGRVSASGSGNNKQAILASLGGEVALSLADGIYQGTDLWYEISSARARLKREEPPPRPAQPQTPLNALELAGTLDKGVLRSRKLLAEIPHIRLTGSGELSLVANSMDYALQAQVFEAPVLADGRELKDLKGLSIPLRVQGALDEPDVSVDLKQLAGEVATQKLKDRLLKKLGGDDEEPAAATEADEAAAVQPAEGGEPATVQPEKPEKPRDILKRGLRDLLKQP